MKLLQRNKMHHLLKGFCVLFALVMGISYGVPALAVDDQNEENRYYLGITVNAGNNDGFSDENEIDEDDPHYGWDLGSFTVNGYTQVLHDENGVPVFLKNVGDEVALWYNLKQNIDKLNDNEDLSISAEEAGWDSYFKTKKTDFGRGCLIIRFTDYHNETHDPQMYTNYLEANTKQNANTKVELCEEGDYEVALDYEIEEKEAFWRPNSYNEYRVFFKFKVRNGNSMVFPRDVKTKEELNNTSFTEDGFFVDLAKSRYLEVMVKKEVLKEGTNGLVEDTRFNRPAKDGEEFTEEGVYSLTAKNDYTQEETTKKIYVGKNSILKAYVTMGLSINEIQYQLDHGATIGDDGVLVAKEITVDEDVDETPLTESEEGITVTEGDSAETPESEPVAEPEEESGGKSWILYVAIGGGVLLLLIIIICVVSKGKKKKVKPAIEQKPDSTDGQKTDVDEDREEGE